MPSSYVNKAVIVTGAQGGIGRALVKRLSGEFHVIGIDKAAGRETGMILFDFASLRDGASASGLKERVNEELARADARLFAIVNNAAIQTIGSVEEVEIEDFERTLFINLTVPFIVGKLFIDQLAASDGSIVNIGSIHAKLTKPGFVSYATSKAGLAGLTRAMAVDLGGRVRVNCVEPAAIATPMLEEGFKTNPLARERLESYHPSGRIGTPEEVASLVWHLVAGEIRFLNGACLGIDGAMGARLHDPD